MKLPRFLQLASRALSRPDPKEVGDSGATYAGPSKQEVSRRLRDFERLSELRLWNRYRIYDRMRKSDPTIAGLRAAQNLPILRAQVRLEPPDEKDAKAVEIAEFVEDNLMHTMLGGWRKFLTDALLHLDYGFSPFEICWDSDTPDGKWRIDRFAWRPPSTIQDIYVARGRIDHVHQLIDNGTDVEIPSEKLTVFTHNQEGDDYRGWPLLRPMHKPWKNGEKLEVLLLILAEKMGGFPVFTEPPGADDPERAEIDAAAAAFRANETMFFRIPTDWQMELVSSKASVGDLLEMKKFWDQQCTRVCQAQVLDLGKTESGSRALGRTMSDMFSDSIQAIANTIEDTLNAPEGPIHQLVSYNYPSSDDYIPSLRFSSVARSDIVAMASGIKTLKDAGVPFSEMTWDWLREVLELPADTAKTPPPPKTIIVPAPAAPAAPEGDAQGKGDNQPPTEAGLAESSFRRPLTRLEGYVALADIAALMDDAKAAVRTRTQQVRDVMVGELVRRATAAIATGDVAKVAALATNGAPMVDQLAARVKDVLRDYYRAGRKQVSDEIARQRQGKPVTEIIAERQGDAVAAVDLADKPPRVPPPTKIPTPSPDDFLDAGSEIAARQIADATVAATAVEAARAMTNPPTNLAQTITDLVTRESDAAALRCAGTVTRLMDDGRTDQAAAMREQISTAVYSAILDQNVCDTCDAMEGDETTDIDSAADWTPNPDCEGGDRCRCLTIYEYGGE